MKLEHSVRIQAIKGGNMIRILLVLIAILPFAEAARAEKAKTISCDMETVSRELGNVVAPYKIALVKFKPSEGKVLSLELRPSKDSSAEEVLRMKRCSQVNLHPVPGVREITQCGNGRGTLRVLAFDGQKLQLGDNLAGRLLATYLCEDESGAQ